MHIKRLLILTLSVLFCTGLWARENIGISGSPNNGGSGKTEVADCNQSTAQLDLDINNVRARLLTGGDLWWDPISQNPHYEVPKVPPGSNQPSIHSIFAGALWIGGIDQLNQLKVAAQTYRQGGNDFWPGPLNDNGEVEQATCAEFDRFFEVLGTDINQYLADLEAAGGVLPPASIPESILQWPGKNNPYFNLFALPQDKELAPFWDADGDPTTYDPTQGDYPVIDPETEGVFADQMIWWMFNDKGNVHTETGGEAIGLEIGALAFAFATNDEVNNMTFYKYSIDNKSTQALDSVYFGQWVDPDLGEFGDDFVGCVPEEGLGIVYNGDAVDGEYGDAPPMLGVDFFEGPKEFNDVTGEFEELGMSAFVFYNNDFSITGNPENASHFYGYLAGVWKDQAAFTCGGNGRGGDEPCAYMFPDDPTLPLPAWSECSADQEPADRRFLQSSGAFRLEPGAQNNIIVGAVWVNEGLQYPCPSFEILLRADKKAQALFDNNFKLKDGPDAPNLTIRELDGELIISLWNNEASNNFNETYVEADPILSGQDFKDSTFIFQGYRLFQLASPTVSSSEYDDPDKAREIAIVDIQDGVNQLVNYSFNTDIGSLQASTVVNSPDEGIRHTFRVTTDVFATGDRSLVNNKKYYFSAKAYANNLHTPYNPAAPSDSDQQEPYLEGRANIKVYTGIPHISTPEADGITLNSTYGEGPEITQVHGIGNGGQSLELTEGSINTILSSSEHRIAEPVYQSGAGPVDIAIYDPMAIPSGEFELEIHNVTYPSVTEPAHGTVTINDDGTLTYTPEENFLGYDNFHYTLGNGKSMTDLGSIVVSIGNPTPASLHVYDDTEVVQSSSTNGVEIDVLANDIIPSDITPTIIGTSDPLNGSVELDADAGTITYTPVAGCLGLDRFAYRCIDNVNYDTIIDRFDATVGMVVPDTIWVIYAATVYVNVYDGTTVNAVDDQIDVDANVSTNIDPLINDTGDAINASLLSPFSSWTLTHIPTGNVYHSERDISRANDQSVGGWEDGSLGFTITAQQVASPDSTVDAFIEASIAFEDPQNVWLSAIGDQDGESVFNWIRSGTFINDQDGTYDDHRTASTNTFYDAERYYTSILNASIAPYCLVNNNAITGARPPLSPGCSDCYGSTLGRDPTFTLPDLPSVQIVLTADQSNWSKCVVVEAGEQSVSEGKAAKNNMRNHESWDGALDGNGQPDYVDPISGSLQANETYYIKGQSASYIEYTNSSGTLVQLVARQYHLADDITGSASFTTFNGAEVFKATDMGRSLFPGYAINLETGERLNIMFAENSLFGSENGKDMIFNPTSTLFPPASFGNARVGGQHYLYIQNTRYDEGIANRDLLINSALNGDIASKKAVYDAAMWTTVPFLTPGFALNSLSNGLIPSDVTIKVKVRKSYQEVQENTPLKYRFNFDNKAAVTGQTDLAKSALDLVRIVPNPYYAFSTYENSQLDNRVRLTNLPTRANISVFTMDGNMVKSFKIDNTGLDTAKGGESGRENINSLDWNITNLKGVPLASGIYLIHVEAPDLGEERTLKWFVIQRPIDLDIF